LHLATHRSDRFATAKDYSLRARSRAKMSWGSLLMAFNDMLGQIQAATMLFSRRMTTWNIESNNETTELSKANGQLKLEFAERERAEQRLLTQHGVTLVLAEAAIFTSCAADPATDLSKSQVGGSGLERGPRCQRPPMCRGMASPALELAGVRDLYSGADLFPGVGLPGRVWSAGALLGLLTWPLNPICRAPRCSQSRTARGVRISSSIRR